MPPRMFAKASGDCSGGGHTHSMGSHTHSHGVRTEVINADLVMGVWENHEVRVLKDRYGGVTGTVSLDDAIEAASIIISKGVFGDNDLKLFQEGLSKEIQIAVKATIEKFHTKEVV